MRRAILVIVTMLVAVPAAGQSARPPTPSAPDAATLAQSYAAIPAAERVAIQFDLIWTGDYNGVADGEFGARAVAAVKAFQKRTGRPQTGILNPPERDRLAAAARTRREQVGWTVTAVPEAGLRFGVPAKLAPQVTRRPGLVRWSAPDGAVQIEAFRAQDPDLAAVFEREKAAAARQVSYSLLRPDFFVIAGLQGGKKFYLRVHGRDGEIRGLRIFYDPAQEATLDAATVAMSNALVAFPADLALARSKVEYATGIVVGRDGTVITDREAVTDCHVLRIAGLGIAERVAEDARVGLALLRVYGAQDRPALAPVAGPAVAATVAGIAAPDEQDGGAAVLSFPAQSRVTMAGFSGAAALSRDGTLVGMARLREGAAPTLLDAQALRQFLAANGVTAAGPAPDNPRRALVRVICVRK